MRKLLFLLLLLPIGLFGQVVSTSVYFAPAVAGGAPPFDGGLMSNGNFASGATDWTVPARWSIVGGFATYDDVTTGDNNLIQFAADMAGAIQTSTGYTITFDIGISSGNANIEILNGGQGTTYVATANYAAGSHTINFTTPSNIWGEDNGLVIRARNTSDNPFTITNITLNAQ